MTSNAKAEGPFGKQDLRYVVGEDVYICPAGERLALFSAEENGLVLHRSTTKACQTWCIKHRCTTGKERRVTRWGHEHILEAGQRRLDEHPEKMARNGRAPFRYNKSPDGSHALHIIMKTLSRVASETALHVLACNLARLMNIVGIQPLKAAIRA